MTTNKAFIKAFRQDAAQDAPTGPTCGNTLQRPALNHAAAPLGTALTATVEYIAAPNVSEVIVNQPQSSPGIWTAALVDTAQTVKPAALPRRTDDSPLFSERRVDLAASGKRPLSSFTNRTQARPAPQPPTASFEPGTKVANFHWPGVCRTLLREHGTHYDHLVDLLLAESAKRSVIGMLGLFPGGGCTTTLLCLAARLAGRGRRVIIVDGNFLAPQLAQWLDVETTATWQDVLADGAPVADAIVRATADNLDLLPLKSQSRDGFKLASSVQVSRTADTLRSVYDLTLVDLGAFFDAQSQPMLLSLVHNLRVDAALAVAGPKAADPRDVATLAEYLREQQCELLGTIENRATK